MAFPTTNNILRLKAGVGITLTSGRISQWDDQSGNANHATQTTAARRYYDVTDDGDDGVLADFLNSTAADQTGMILPSGVAFDSRGTTFACVCESFDSSIALDRTGSFFQSLIGSTSERCNVFPWWNPATYKSTIVVYDGSGPSGLWDSGLIIPSGRSIIVVRWKADDVDVWVDGQTASKGSPMGSFTSTGGWVGEAATPGSGSFKGVWREFAVWDTAISDTARDDLIAQWQSDWSVPSSRARNFIIIGDSISMGWGVDAGTLKDYPRQCVNIRRKVDQLWNMGINAGRIDDCTTWWGYWSSKIVSATKKNIVLINPGINDIVGGASAATIETRMDALLSAIRADLNTGDEIGVLTILGLNSLSGAQETIRDTENAKRADGTTYDVDFCVDMTGDADLENSASSYFYSDNIHPNSTGYAAMAGYVDPYIVPPATPIPIFAHHYKQLHAAG